MAIIDLGDYLPDLSVKVRDADGVLANATAVVLTITLPDGTTATPAVTNASTGVYTAAYLPVQRGRHVAAWVATGVNASALTTTYIVVDPAGSIVGLAEAQAFLRVHAETDQDAVRGVVEAASKVVERYTHRAWRTQTIVETQDGDGRSVLALRQYPPRTVTSVVEDGTALTSGDWTLDAHAGLLYRGGPTSVQPWACGVGTVVVTYQAGPTVVPEDVADATLQVVRVLWEQRRGGTRQQGSEQYAEQRDLIPRAARLILDTYVVPGFA